MFIILGSWPLLGILIGLHAAHHRGFSAAGGAIGGLLLGPLAFLMYFATSPSSRKCPACAEWVKNEATICKHCGRALQPVFAPEHKWSTGFVWFLWIVVCLLVAVVMYAIGLSLRGAL